VCDCYFGLLILLIILFRTQKMVSKPMVVWGKGGKVIGFLLQLERE